MIKASVHDFQPAARMLYGLRDSVLVHISKVEKGLACDCTCPGCGADLIARKGKVKQHHFAHASGSECAKGLETGLHLAAKDILAKRGEIVLPAAAVKFPGGKRPFEVAAEGLYAVSNVRLESGFGGLIPDVLVDIDGQPLAIEIFVTHRVDEEKTEKLRQLGLSTIEIDLSMVDRDLDPPLLESIVIDECDRKRWLFHSEVAQQEKRLRSEAKELEIVSRGPVSHVDYCPIPMREYKGKPYANVIDDCVGCPHSLEIEGGVVVCDAHLGLKPEVLTAPILVWNGFPKEARFFLNGEFIPMVWVDTVLRKRDGTLLFRGNDRKHGTRQTYSVNEVEGIVDIDTGEFTEIHVWLNEITRGRAGGQTPN